MTMVMIIVKYIFNILKTVFYYIKGKLKSNKWKSNHAIAGKLLITFL